MYTRYRQRSISSEDFAGETTFAIHDALERVVALGAEIVVLRTRSGEVIGAAERPGWQGRRGPKDGTVILRSLDDVDFGVFTRSALNTDRLDEIAREVERLIADRWMAFLD